MADYTGYGVQSDRHKCHIYSADSVQTYRDGSAIEYEMFLSYI